MLKSTFEYTKQRRTFGSEALFSVVPAQMLDSIVPNKEEQNQYILRNPVHREAQAVLPQSEHDANTKQLIIREQGIYHAEGGWPRDVQRENEEHVQRYVRRLVHEDHYINAVANVSGALKHCLDQNNAIDMYAIYFSNFQSQEPVEKYCIRTVNTFRDDLHRSISCLDWTHDNNSKVVASHYYFAHATDPSNFSCQVWDIQNQNKPIHKLDPSHPCWRLACSPVDPEVVICGLENGTVCVFDIREGRDSVLTSSIYNSHTQPITGLLYTHNRTNTEFYTGSPDGQCIWWDIRDLSEPTDRAPVSIKLSSNQKPSQENAEGVSAIQFDKGVPSKFLVGTETGYVVNGNRMGKTHSEVLYSYYKTHEGVVRKVQRSPCTFRMFLTCGEWDVRIWSEEVRTAPIIVTKPYKYEVVDAAWAPQRYSCYMAVCNGGIIYYWDFLRKYKDPVATLQLSSHPLTTVAPHADGELVITGDENGTIFLLHLSENMAFPDVNNKSLMGQTYERETRREHILDNRVKEINLKKREEVAATAAAIISEEEILEEEDPDRETEEEYFRIVKDELYNMYGTSEITDISNSDHY